MFEIVARFRKIGANCEQKLAAKHEARLETGRRQWRGGADLPLLFVPSPFIFNKCAQSSRGVEPADT
jgi:hypothetical protein